MILQDIFSTSTSKLNNDRKNIPKDDLLIVGKTTSKLIPEMHKLLSSSSIGLVAADDSSATRLLTRVVVPIQLH